MTAFLPALAWNPFVSRLDQTSHAFDQSATLITPTSPRSASAWAKLLPNQDFYPRSRELVTPSNTTRTKENIVTKTVPIDAEQNSSTLSASARPFCLPAQSCYDQTRPAAAAIATNKLLKTPKSSDHTRKQPSLQHSQASKYHLQNDTPTKAKQEGLGRSPRAAQTKTAINNSATREHSLSPEPFPALSSGSEERSLPNRTIDSKCSDKLGFDTPTKTDFTANTGCGAHRQRSSNASSGFVHTMKTASISNTSLSILPRSLRIGRSSDSYGCMTGYSRCSLDSTRPTPNGGLDEASLQRGLKRKQIINELIMTEESYVADLKALVYLYSTLMVSSTTISARLRLSIQRNVVEVLYIHERLLQKLHHAALKAAARKWADTTTPQKLGFSLNIHKRTVVVNRGNTHARIRSSIDSAEVAKAHLTAGVAEPADIFDIAEILEEVMTQLFVYEEYCANHQTIAHELQKHLPSLWSSYETGVESLNRSLIALNRRKSQERRGLTVGDLLIKPVQRLCKYPLLLQDLLNNTHVADSPTVHKVLEGVLRQFCVIVRTVNLATDNHITRAQIQRKWLLLDRLALDNLDLSQDWFRALGAIHLCGVLYLTYEGNTTSIEGRYAVVILFDNHFLVTIPTPDHMKIEPVAAISLSDLEIKSTVDGRGLQSPSSLHTFKVAFSADGNAHELLLSACSTEEEEQWLRGLRGSFRPPHLLDISTLFDQSRTFRTLRSLGKPQCLLSPSTDSTPNKGDEPLAQTTTLREVVIRNTHNPGDLQDFKNAMSQLSVTSMTAKILMPKRAERRRLETSIADIYTKDKLPFPGMVGSKGGRMIRASAGSLVRKLSFASMQASISRRSASLSSKRSYHTIHAVPQAASTLSVRKHSTDDHTPNRCSRPKELPELDTMSSVIERMIGGGTTARKRLSFSSGEKLIPRYAKSQHTAGCQVGPDDPAKFFYEDEGKMEEIERKLRETQAKHEDGMIESSLVGLKKKRWSNPIAKLRGLGSDGFKNMLYSSN